MEDETYSFISDVKEKGAVARSAKSRCTYTRGGKVRFPSDNLSKKELQKMSGDCVSYRLNEPMTWAEFMKMPDDIKVTYIKLLQGKWKVPVTHIGKMMGVGQSTIQRETARLGIVIGKGVHKQVWDKEAFYAWVNGVPTPVPEEDVQEEKKRIFFGGTEDLPEEKIHWVEPEPVQQDEEPESFVEDDLHWNVPETVPEVKFAVSPYQPIPQTTCPTNGSMNFRCPASIALNTMKELLQNEMVSIRVTWDVIEEGGADNG